MTLETLLLIFRDYKSTVYPFEGPDEVVRKDRRGELFYYMHEQVREWLCVDLTSLVLIIDMKKTHRLWLATTLKDSATICHV